MKKSDKYDKLINDVFKDASYDDAKERIRSAAKAELARKRPGGRRVARVFAAAACALVAFGLAFFLFPRETAERTAMNSGRTVAAQNPPSFLIESRPLADGQTVRTSDRDGVTIRTREIEGLYIEEKSAPALVTTDYSKKSLSDEELCALFPDKPVMIIGDGDGGKRFCFVNPEDEKTFFEEY